MLRVQLASSQKEIEAIIELRYKILRLPWNQSIESATDTLEEKSVNAFISDIKGNIVACGRLQQNDAHVGQVRFMAVDTAYQGKGFGKLILKHLEQKAIDMHLTKIELQARENAVDFYKANHYSIKEKSFLLWGLIQHYLMEKNLL